MRRAFRERRATRRGVTLIEMLVVVTIISVFLLVVGPRLLGQADKGKAVAARQQIASFSQALASYKLEVGTYPTTEMGFRALRERPANANNWGGPYLSKEIPKDPWGNDFLYKFPGDHGDEPDIVCLGADGQVGGEGINGDIVSWKN
jgi:general secretion pathway protein G